jgi:flagellar motor switch protein FliM
MSEPSLESLPRSPTETTPAHPAAILDGDGEAGFGSAPLLNQDEIDSLLGFDDGDAPARGRPGIEAILTGSLVSYERLPMLEVVFERLARMMSTSLRNFTSDNAEVSLQGRDSVRFGEHLAQVPQPAMYAVIKAEQWDNYILAIVESPLVYTMIDVLLGGHSGTAPMRIEGRPFTTIERNLIEEMLRLVVADLSRAFEPLSTVSFQFERLETNPNLAAIARPSNAAIVGRFAVEIVNRGGSIALVIPYATLEPIREILLQMFIGEKFGRDSIWENHLARELWRTRVELTAVMDERVMPLGDIFRLQVGSRLLFDAKPDSTVEVRCEGIPMFEASMGRHGSRVAVRIEERIDVKKRGDDRCP